MAERMIHGLEDGGALFSPTITGGDPHSVVSKAQSFVGDPVTNGPFDGWTSRSSYTPKRSSVVLSKDWAELLGVPRSGRFYRLSKPELRRRLADLPCLQWTDTDDRAVADLMEAAGRKEPCRA